MQNEEKFIVEALLKDARKKKDELDKIKKELNEYLAKTFPNVDFSTVPVKVGNDVDLKTVINLYIDYNICPTKKLLQEIDKATEEDILDVVQKRGRLG